MSGDYHCRRLAPGSGVGLAPVDSQREGLCVEYVCLWRRSSLLGERDCLLSLGVLGVTLQVWNMLLVRRGSADELVSRIFFFEFSSWPCCNRFAKVDRKVDRAGASTVHVPPLPKKLRAEPHEEEIGPGKPYADAAAFNADHSRWEQERDARVQQMAERQRAQKKLHEQTRGERDRSARRQMERMRLC